MRTLIVISLLIVVAVMAMAQNDTISPERHHMLDEVTVRARSQRYSKKNNPAVEFVQKVMDRRHLTDPRQTNAHYSHGTYERISLGLLDFKADSGSAIAFMQKYVESSPLSGLDVLNLTVKEKISDVYHRRDPATRREVVRLRNRSGIDDLIADEQSMQVIVDDVLRPIDLYDSNDITLLRTRFVSPLGRLATDFYKYFLSDTIADSETGDSLVVLSFVPHNPSMTGFNGRLYVAKDDTTMFIRRVEMRLPKAANVNYISNLLISQEYDRAPDGSRLKTRDHLAIEAGALGSKAFAQRLSVYNNHRFTPPLDTTVFDSPLDVIERPIQDTDIEAMRPAGIGSPVEKMKQLVDEMMQRKFFRYSAKLLRVIIDDRIPLFGPNAKVAYEPILSTIAYNDLEGLRLRGGLVSTTYLSPHFFAKAYGAYGFRDRKWKYGGEAEYSFNRKEKHALEFPIRSIKASHSYDINKLGQSYGAGDAIYNSITFTRNDLLTYRRLTSVEFRWETDRQLALSVAADIERQYPTPTVPFTDGQGNSLHHTQQALLRAEARFTPGDKYYQSTRKRVRINKDAPTITLRHTFSPTNFLASRHGINKTEAYIDKRFYFSAWGHLDLTLSGGHIWGKTDFLHLLAPEANISIIYNPRTFGLMNAMEFLNDSYASLHINYSGGGALLNYIPLIKKLKLRETLGFHALCGHLSQRNDPLNDPSLLRLPESTQRMTHRPYMEFNVGLDNIFTVLRVDYVRRLSYTDLPGAHRNGVRILLHFQF